MVQGDHRLNVVFQQGIDQIAIEFDPGLIDGAPALWQQARPGDREAVALHPHFGHQRHVLTEAVIVIDGNVAVCALVSGAWQVGEGIPDGWAFAVGIVCAFNLIRRASRAPEELFRESRHNYSLYTLNIESSLGRVEMSLQPVSETGCSFCGSV
ncbi:Uncharacterised protein [Serratia fonticola]|uniref:Uncharacterized protein n=1 Tax=Serratia fonticola TaxID=47917 RepID=A0A4V6KV75_SERFO|nr:Uncharacterised protein [Serratia fonticola]